MRIAGLPSTCARTTASLGLHHPRLPSSAPAAHLSRARTKCAATTTNEGSDNSSGGAAKLAVAAKISAARTLARKLSEEKQAAAAASQLASDRTVDPETAAELIRSAEVEVAELAKEAAQADALARAAVRADRPSSAPQLQELQRLKDENRVLQELVMQLAADRKEAERRLEELREKGPAVVAATIIDANSGNGAGTAVSGNQKATTAPKAGQPQLAAVVEDALKEGRRVTTVPGTPIPVGSTIKILYNLGAGPLPDLGAPVLKLGWNRWETQSKVAMQKVAELEGKVEGSWWASDVAVPKLLFRMDFVVEDAKSGAVDNNGGKDFYLDLANAPTAQEVTAARLELLEAAEAQAQAAFKEEEDRIYAAWMASAEGAAKEARLAFISARRETMLREARSVVEERRGAAAKAAAAGAGTEKKGTYIWATPPEAGATAVLLYNKAGAGLASAGSVMAHVGYDGWWMQDKRVLPMRPLTPAEAKKYKISSQEGEWWCTEVSIWNTAAVIDFAFTNDARSVWDNADGADFHTPVKGAASGDKLVSLVLSALEAADVEESTRGEMLAERRVLQRAAVKATAGRRRREVQRKYLYTEPTSPRAGHPLKVFYNPDRTVLRGRPDVYVRGSFNRWRHAEQIKPTPLIPAVPDAGGLGFLYAEIDVPADAFAVDLVFQDSADTHGGFMDDNRGLDYHIPVSGSSTSAPTLRVVHVAAEMAPIAKAGGLGDVVTALGRAVQEEGHEVEIVMPKYDCIDYAAVEKLVLVKEFMHGGVQVKVWRGIVEGLTTTFLEPCNGLFWVGSIYTDMAADRHRFGVFCECSLHYLLNESPRRPDILHCHDWQSAPVAMMDRQGTAAAFTIHNLNYGADLIGAAMIASQVATTVSPTYATEIAGHPAIAEHHSKFYGIRNGIDMDIWDPAADPLLPMGYTAEDSVRGKAAAKAELRRRMGLAEGDVPVVGCVTRLTHQKGIHLIKHAAWRAMERGAQFVLLGSAPDPKVQAEFDALAADLGRQYPDRARLWFAYDEPLSHLIYAGSDLFLVPSMFEPCGLTQMIAMRYGTVPVVRRTGGLADTVFDLDDDEDRAAAQGMAVNGFSFDGADSEGLDYALNRALATWYGDREAWNELVVRVMEMDWSWSGPAKDYIELYHRALKKV